MIRADTIGALESRALDGDYILGAQRRSMKEVRERVLADQGRYLEIQPCGASRYSRRSLS
jgi:hypothetical protein